MVEWCRESWQCWRTIRAYSITNHSRELCGDIYINWGGVDLSMFMIMIVYLLTSLHWLSLTADGGVWSVVCTKSRNRKLQLQAEQRTPYTWLSAGHSSLLLCHCNHRVSSDIRWQNTDKFTGRQQLSALLNLLPALALYRSCRSMPAAAAAHALRDQLRSSSQIFRRQSCFKVPYSWTLKYKFKKISSIYLSQIQITDSCT